MDANTGLILLIISELEQGAKPAFVDRKPYDN